MCGVCVCVCVCGGGGGGREGGREGGMENIEPLNKITSPHRIQTHIVCIEKLSDICDPLSENPAHPAF